jgi:hypothetical protein
MPRSPLFPRALVEGIAVKFEEGGRKDTHRRAGPLRHCEHDAPDGDYPNDAHRAARTGITAAYSAIRATEAKERQTTEGKAFWRLVRPTKSQNRSVVALPRCPARFAGRRDTQPVRRTFLQRGYGGLSDPPCSMRCLSFLLRSKLHRHGRGAGKPAEGGVAYRDHRCGNAPHRV